jgi:hypothetical protein
LVELNRVEDLHDEVLALVIIGLLLLSLLEIEAESRVIWWHDSHWTKVGHGDLIGGIEIHGHRYTKLIMNWHLLFHILEY